MKKLKLMTAIIVVLVFSNLLFAAKPLTGNVTDFVNSKLMQLNWEIALTDSQKALVKVKASEYAIKILNKDSIACQEVLPQATQEYESAIESILTSEQKAQIIQKQNDRKNAAIRKYKDEK